ncbi:MAG: hypothetical protein GY943_22980, partial [Chloroflexi bacterium]|nr:hypothetical protein [Chloroflexota bacterium]
GNGDTAQTEYTFTFTDFVLDMDNLSHPCAASDLTLTLHTNSIDTPFATLPREINGSCRVDGHETNPVTVTACDIVGHCTSETTSTFEPVIRILDGSAPETDGTGVISFTVQLTAPMTQTVTVDYFTVDETAVAHIHYTPVTDTLTFAPGETSQIITVPILGDDLYNEDRTFTVHLANAGLTTIADNIATGTIVNDDLVVVFLPIVTNNYPLGPDLIVNELTVSKSEIEVVIKNVGDTAVTNEFWVDVYIDPVVVPTAVNQTIDTLNSDGAVWGVTASALPLAPGESLTLRLNDSYFVYSRGLNGGVGGGTAPMPWQGRAVYAQVDSAHATSGVRAVLESRERRGETYNN